MKIGMVVNDIGTEKADYTTTRLAITATNRGHEVWYMGVADFAYGGDERNHARARSVPQRRRRSGCAYLRELMGKEARAEYIVVDDLDVLLLRNDPAEDVIDRPWARLVGINFGRLAVHHGVLVLNDPDGLGQAVNKMYLQYFPEKVRPRTLISSDRDDIKAFIREEGGHAVIKPLFGSGGRNVFLVRPEDRPNLNQMIAAVSREGYVIAQQYLPEAVHGDTRLFLLNGRPLMHRGRYAAMRRVRRDGDGDMRSNITAGAEAERTEVDDRVLEVAEMVRPKLVEDGMFLVGLDIVGDKLMEINVFSPGGLGLAAQLEEVDFSRVVIESLERKMEFVKHSRQAIDNVKMATL